MKNWFAIAAGVIIFTSLFAFFAPIYPTELICPSTIEQCRNITKDSISYIEYLNAFRPTN